MEDKNNILAKWLANELSDQELKDFENSEDFHLYQNIKFKMEQAKLSDFDKDQMLENIINPSRPIIKITPFYQQSWFKIAAVFVVLSGFLLSYLFLQNNDLEKISGQNSLAFNLPDYSKVTLNKNSKLTYSEDFEDRNVYLNQGEAYFEVKKGSKFCVHTDQGKVEVLGTKFNIKLSSSTIDVECYEGKVKISKNKFNFVLEKGKKLFYHSIVDDLYKLENLNIEEPQWLKNNLSFVDESLENVINTLMKHYNMGIILKVESNKKFNGTLPSDNVENALQILSTTYQFKFKKISTNTIEIE